MYRTALLFLLFAYKGFCLTSTWTIAGGGSWNNGANWDTNPLFPNGIDDAAIIQQNIVATTPIALGQNITIGFLNMGDTSGLSTYQIGPANTLTFQTSSGNAVWTSTGGSLNNLACGVVLANSLVFQGTASGIVTGQLSGPGALIVDQAGNTLLLDDPNIYTGGTFVRAGAINMQSDGCIPPGSTATIGTGAGPPLNAQIVCPGGTVMTPANAFFADILSDGALTTSTPLPNGICVTGVSGTGEIRFTPVVVDSFIQVTGTSGDSTFGGDMTGGVVSASSDSTTGQRFLKSGASRLAFTAPLSYAGRMFVQGGTLAAQSNNALGASGTSATFVLAGATLEMQNGISLDKPLFLNGGGSAGSGALFNAAGSNALVSSPVAMGWSDVPSGVVASDPTVNVAGGTDLTIASSVQGGNGWTKAGEGTLILSGANSYTGATSVADGLLLIHGSTADVPITVSSGATLGGNGFIGTGSASVVNNGTLSPGASIGTLTIGGSFSQGAGGIYLQEILDASTFDLLIVNGGGVSLDGNLTVQFLPGFSIQPGDQIVFIDNTGGTGVMGNFSSVSTINVPSYLQPIPLNMGDHVLLQFLLDPQALSLEQISNVSLPLLASIDRRTFDLERKLSYARRRIKPYVDDPESRLVAQADFPRGLRKGCAKPKHPVVLFADALGTIGTVYKTKTENPFGYSSAGVLAGGMYTFSRGAAGSSIDFESLSGTVANHSGKFDLSSWSGTLFGTVLPFCSLDLYFDATAGFGYQFYKIQRSTEEGAVSGKPHGWDAFAYSEAGYSWESVCGTVTPLAGLEYAYLSVDGYNEKGESNFRLSIDSQTIQSLRSVLGARWGWEWVRSTKILSLEARGLWLREYLNENRNVGFASIPFSAPASAIQVLSPARNTYLAGGILRLSLNESILFESSYDFEWNSSLHTHFLFGGIEARF
jgi:autotransporter-associated beta strand protein